MEIQVKKVYREDEDERIVLEVLEDCNLWPFILFDTTYDENGQVSNINRHVYIFNNMNVIAGDYIVLHTGIGENRSFKNKKGTKTHEFFWGYDGDARIWNQESDVALLVKVSEYKHCTL